jgi:hypothetical protein
MESRFSRHERERWMDIVAALRTCICSTRIYKYILLAKKWEVVEFWGLLRNIMLKKWSFSLFNLYMSLTKLYVQTRGVQDTPTWQRVLPLPRSPNSPRSEYIKIYYNNPLLVDNPWLKVENKKLKIYIIINFKIIKLITIYISF